MIVRANQSHFAGWLRLREALWPDAAPADHHPQGAAMLAETEGMAVFVAIEQGEVIGFAEATIRHDYVNGCESSPVAFLEGIYVGPGWRHRGFGRALADAVADWAVTLNLQELASDAELENAASHAFHRAAGFSETERVVYFRRALTPSPPASPPPPPPAPPPPASGWSPRAA